MFVIVRVECGICGCDVIWERQDGLLVIVDVCREDACRKVWPFLSLSICLMIMRRRLSNNQISSLNAGAFADLGNLASL